MLIGSLFISPMSSARDALPYFFNVIFPTNFA